MVWLFTASIRAFPVAREANLVKKHRLGIMLAWKILNHTMGGNENGINIGWVSYM
jgi:hypothetical protein